MGPDIVLGFAPPGKRREIKKFIDKQNRSVIVHDLDTLIAKNQSDDNIGDTISSLSKEQLRNVWRENIDAVIRTIWGNNGPETNVILCHATYFNTKNKEFFPAFDSNYFFQR